MNAYIFVVTIIVGISILIGCFVTVKYSIEMVYDVNRSLGFIYTIIDRLAIIIIFDLV